MTDEIRQQVRDEMSHQQVTQKALAERTGINLQYVWDMLNGKSSNMPRRWGQVLDALGLELVVRRKP